jgi:hypothetical protein
MDKEKKDDEIGINLEELTFETPEKPKNSLQEKLLRMLRSSDEL